MSREPTRSRYRSGRTAVAACIALGLVLLCADGIARPGGGSGFKSSGSSRSGSSSSSSGSRSSTSSGSRSSSYSGSRSSSSSSSSSSGGLTSSKTYGGSSRSGSSGTSSSTPSIPVVSYRTVAGADRAGLRRWQPGTLGPYGPGPARPARLRVEQPGDLAVGATLLMVLGSLSVAFPMALVGGLVLVFRKRRGNGWTTAAAKGSQPSAEPPPSGALRRALASLRAADPDFSVGLFEDFAYALYSEAHTARGAKTLARLAPYLRPAARSTLESLGSNPVSAIVVGAMRYAGFDANAGGGTRVEVIVDFEACYTETDAANQARSFYAAERWCFVRSKTARSRPPEKIRVFACPSCGAPLDRMVGGACGYCSKVVEGGAFDWAVESVVIQERSPSPPVLTGTAEEVGTNLPTIFDPRVREQLAALKARDPAVDEQGLMARVALVFRTMQTAWTSLAWESARPYLSDNLFQTNAYWIAAYRSQGLRNVTQNVEIQRIELVRVDSDRWYDAFTVRVHATGLDYTIRDADEAVVGGNRSKLRPYTEYWTFVRGASRRGPTQTQPVCPSCGGPMNVSMAALCKNCGVKVNSGEFDWVLSRIEQDEVYGG